MSDTDQQDRLYFRQLLSGRDFAQGDGIAAQMRNFAYLIGDRQTGDCVVVDPAYAAGDLVDALEADGMHLSGVLVTHHHPDHVGGSMMGFELKGLAELLERVSVPVHVNSQEALFVSRITGIPMSDLTSHEHGDKVGVGAIDIELLHTPGHTPGSQCFLARRSPGRRRHIVLGGMRAHRLSWRGFRRDISQPAEDLLNCLAIRPYFPDTGIHSNRVPHYQRSSALITFTVSLISSSGEH